MEWRERIFLIHLHNWIYMCFLYTLTPNFKGLLALLLRGLSQSIRLKCHLYKIFYKLRSDVPNCPTHLYSKIARLMNLRISPPVLACKWEQLGLCRETKFNSHSIDKAIHLKIGPLNNTYSALQKRSTLLVPFYKVPTLLQNNALCDAFLLYLKSADREEMI